MGEPNGFRLENELQKTYWDYVIRCSKEYMEKQLTGRLVIDFQKGIINSIQNQEVIAGQSVLFYNLNRLK